MFRETTKQKGESGQCGNIRPIVTEQKGLSSPIGVHGSFIHETREILADLAPKTLVCSRSSIRDREPCSRRKTDKRTCLNMREYTDMKIWK